MDLAIMLEGQNGLTWAHWRRIARAVEDLGFSALYRSDHFTNSGPPDKDSLELWTSLTWLASHTSHIEFGPMVSPVSFRHPVFTARMGKDVDDLSGGRLQLGVGAGWQEREHTNFGFPLLEMKARMTRFEEALEVITRLLHNESPMDFTGDYYTLREAILLPRPARPGGPPILIGGSGRQRTLRLVARYADYWNAPFIRFEEFDALNKLLTQYLAEAGRQPGDVHRSAAVMTIYARDDAGVQRKLESRGRTAEFIRERGGIVGTAGEVVDQLGALAELGCQRALLQWLELDDVDGIESLATEVLPHFRPAPARTPPPS